MPGPRKKRDRISVRTRFEVFKRDNFACRYCSRRPPDVELELDHVVAVASGGDDEPDNLVTSCSACNSGKSAQPVDHAALPPISLDRLLELQEAVERQRIYVELRRERERIYESQMWEVLVAWAGAFGGKVSTDDDGSECIDFIDHRRPSRLSIMNLLREGVPVDVLLRAVEATHHARFSSRLPRHAAERYFFGCVRRMRDEP